ncbi:DUF2085 domain-containing protein [Candidatus Micrarchaeota archaeon]|nr:DUF2085 domain-containing protein [Candidatus Micrarchaeota archaeon]
MKNTETSKQNKSTETKQARNQPDKTIQDYSKLHTQNRSNQLQGDSKLAYYFYLALTLLILFSVVVTPLLESLGGLFETIAGVSYAAYSLSCHQLPQRSLFAFGEKFAVCTRCFAIYFGMFASALAFPLFARATSRKIPHWAWLALAIAPMAIDGLTQLASYYSIALPFIGLRYSTNDLRLATGFIAGFAVSFYAIPLLNILYYSLHRQTKSKP